MNSQAHCDTWLMFQRKHYVSVDHMLRQPSVPGESVEAIWKMRYP